MNSGRVLMRERASRCTRALMHARAHDRQSVPNETHVHSHACASMLPVSARERNSLEGATHAKRKVWAHRP
eukprot:15469714-Alexandrium_andersonii.AAC.1